ncbi:MAG: putative lipoprotein [Rickettsiaceae bacterium]|jgi:ABC-type branched-subunit amino acid transport system substrate-binding protein|nr:putative lipoprotein [Rickettsiaceae bacterium]
MKLARKFFITLSCLFLFISCSAITQEITKKKNANKKTEAQSKAAALPKPIHNSATPKAGPQTLPVQAVPQTKIIKKKVKVAALLPLSGKNKELGEALLNSITMSLFENDKNADIDLVVFDSEDLKKSVSKIAEQNIKTVIGPVFSSDVEEMLKLVSPGQMTILSFSNNQDLANKKGVFLMGFLPEQQIERITSYAISSGKENFAIIAPNNQYGKKFTEILKEMVRRKDANLISAGMYTNSTKDLERVVSKTVGAYTVPPRVAARKNSPVTIEDNKIYADVIFIPESGAVLSKIVSLIKKYNKDEREIQIIGSSNWDDVDVLKDPNLIGGWFTSTNSDKYRDFEKEYYKTYNSFPPRITSIAHDAMVAVAEAVRKSKNRELSAADFVNYISSKNSFEGVDGLFRFLPNGIVQRNFAVLEIENGEFDVIDSPSRMFFKY